MSNTEIILEGAIVGGILGSAIVLVARRVLCALARKRRRAQLRSEAMRRIEIIDWEYDRRRKEFELEQELQEVLDKARYEIDRLENGLPAVEP